MESPVTPGGEMPPVSESQQSSNPPAPAGGREPATTAPPVHVPPPIPLNGNTQVTPATMGGGDAGFLFGPPAPGEINTANHTPQRIPPPPDAAPLMAVLERLANSPDASPAVKQLLQLLTYHTTSA